MANVQLNWTGSNTGIYEVEFRRTIDASWTEPSSSPVTGTTLNLSGLDPNTQYIFRVRGICDTSISPWDYDTFTTGSGSCAPITDLFLSSPSETTFNVSWTASLSAVNGYIVQWKQSSDASWLSSTVQTATSYVVTGLTAGTSYQARVVSLCAGTDSATSGSDNISTSAHYTQCLNISASSVSIVANTSNYTASWTNTGIPATCTFQFSIDGGTTWNALSSTIINQTSATVTYTLPSPASGFPVTHLLKVTPTCSDASTGTPSTGTYTAPDTPTQYVIVTNNLSGISIPSLSVDGGPNALASSIASGASFNYYKPGIFSGAHDFYITAPGLTNGSYLTLEQVRSSSVIATNSFRYTGGSIPLAVGQSFLDHDILRVSKTPSTSVCITLSYTTETVGGVISYYLTASSSAILETNVQVIFSYTLPGHSTVTGQTITIHAGSNSTAPTFIDDTTTTGVASFNITSLSPDHSVNQNYTAC